MDTAQNIGETCSYFLQAKKRNCRMSVKSGRKFCGEHAAFENFQNSDEKTNDNSSKTSKTSRYERVDCPYDPKQ